MLIVSGGANNSKLTLRERAALRQQEQQQASAAANNAVVNDPPPKYAANTTVAPPSPAPSTRKGVTYVVALYDYEAQAEGDLSFKKDDKIEVISRTDDQNDWWTGRLCNGSQATGIFPGTWSYALLRVI